jgi:hypothetical protein
MDGTGSEPKNEKRRPSDGIAKISFDIPRGHDRGDRFGMGGEPNAG